MRFNNHLKDRLQTNATGKTSEDWRGLLQLHIATLVDNEMAGMTSTHRTGRAIKAIRQRLKGKEGRIRGNLMGKRVDFSARTVITPDPTIGIDELGVPIKIAMDLTRPIQVNRFNINELYRYVRNGPDVHPGAKTVINMKKQRQYSLKNVDRSLIRLEIGDIVRRHMIDGDWILFNRQPSLHKMSMMGHKVCVTPGETFRLNITVTSPYNADFDGDEMNMHLPQKIPAANELECLANVEKQIISPRESKPIITLVQDNLVGSHLLTEKNQANQKDHAFSHQEMMNLAIWNSKYEGCLLYTSPSPRD